MADKEIKQKIVLTGEKEYSQALRDANRNLKTLKSELKAETAELGANATAQQKAETRTKNLKKQIAEQEKIVRTYRAALEEVREKYGDNEDAIASWEQKLNNARTTLGNMRNELDGVGGSLKNMQTDAGTAVVATKSVADAIGQIASAGQAVSDKIESIFTGMVSAIRDAMAEVWSMVTETAAKANNWTDIAGYWNTDPQTIQQWARAVQASANSFGDLESSMSKIVMGDHDKIMKLTGVSWMGDTDQWQYALDVFNAIADMDYAHQMNALGEIFGDRRATKIKDLLNDWDAIQALVPQFDGNETGYGMNDQELQTMNDLWEQINKIDQKWEALKDKVAAGFGAIIMPLTVNVEGALDGVADYLAADNEADRQEALDKIRTNLEEFFRKLADVVRECLKILSEVGQELQNSDDPVTKAIGDILVGLTDALNWMIENQEAVKLAFEAIFGAWLLGKLTAVAGQLLKITTYLKTIKGYNLLQNLPGANGNNTGTGVPSMPGLGGGNGATPTTGSTPAQTPTTGSTPAQTPTTGSTPAQTPTTAPAATPRTSTPASTPKSNVPLKDAGGAPARSTGSAPSQGTPSTQAQDPNWKMNPVPEGGNHATQTAAGGTGVGLAAFMKDVALLLGEDALVLAASLVPAGLTQAAIDQKLAEKSEEAAQTAEEAAEKLGDEFDGDIARLRKIIAATEPTRDEGGEYSRGLFGQYYWNPGDDMDAILAGLGDPKNRGQLYADIRKYGAEGGVLGWDPWTMLQRYWGEYTEPTYYGSEFPWKQGEYAGEKRVDNPLDPSEVDALLTYLQDMYVRKLEEQMESTFGASAGTGSLGAVLPPSWRFMSADAWNGIGNRSSSQQEGVSSQDLQGFRGLPGQVAQSAREGVAAGISGIKVYMDGTVVGHLVAPTVSRDIARQVF